MLKNQPKVIIDYKDYLLESFRKCDSPTKREILDIF